MKKGYDTKQSEKKSNDPEIANWDYIEFERNQLQLSEALKKEIADQNLDWRFIRASGYSKLGYHKGNWKPYYVTGKHPIESFKGIHPEGILTRGDLILAVRPKSISGKHRAKLQEKNSRLAGYNKQAADNLRQLAKENRVSGDVIVHEGYDDNN